MNLQGTKRCFIVEWLNMAIWCIHHTKYLTIFVVRLSKIRYLSSFEIQENTVADNMGSQNLLSESNYNFIPSDHCLPHTPTPPHLLIIAIILAKPSIFLWIPRISEVIWYLSPNSRLIPLNMKPIRFTHMWQVTEILFVYFCFLRLNSVPLYIDITICRCADLCNQVIASSLFCFIFFPFSTLFFTYIFTSCLLKAKHTSVSNFTHHCKLLSYKLFWKHWDMLTSVL